MQVHELALPGYRDDLPDGPYFKSKMERNWSRYLDWLISQSRDPVVHWRYEHHEFWFPGIRRGTVSYRPDFFVWENRWSHEGKIMLCRLEVHELAGRVTDKHRVRIDRMRRYFPWIPVKLIDQKAYRAVERKAKDLVPGWE